MNESNVSELALATPGLVGSDALACIKANRSLIREAMSSLMRPDVDYGVIPGTGDKPTLLKPGAEKLASMFRIVVDCEIEDLSADGMIRYRVRAKCSHMGTGLALGTGVGECSSDEAKYRWRAAVCKEEWDATPENQRREKWKKYGKENAFAIHQIRTEPADAANTILKMAKKRAFVDAMLTITAASDIFTQDMEDTREDPNAGSAGTAPPAGAPATAPEIKTPTAKPKTNGGAKPPAAGAKSWRGKVEDVILKKSGNTNGKPWTVWTVKAADFSGDTFSKSFADAAGQASQDGIEVVIGYDEGQYGNEIKSVEVAA